MMRLWRGDVALGRALIYHALLLGTLVNLLATGVALTIIASGGSTPAAFAVSKIPLPYMIVAVVGVWRSASRSTVRPVVADGARAAAVLWFAAMMIF